MCSFSHSTVYICSFQTSLSFQCVVHLHLWHVLPSLAVHQSASSGCWLMTDAAARWLYWARWQKMPVTFPLLTAALYKARCVWRQALGRGWAHACEQKSFFVCNWFISWIISPCRHGHSSGESLEMTIKVLGMKNTTHTLLALQSSAFQMAKKNQTAHVRKVCTWAPCWVRLTLWWWVRGCLFGSLNCQDKIWQVDQGCSSNHCCLSSWCMFAM